MVGRTRVMGECDDVWLELPFVPFEMEVSAFIVRYICNGYVLFFGDDNWAIESLAKSLYKNDLRILINGFDCECHPCTQQEISNSKESGHASIRTLCRGQDESCDHHRRGGRGAPYRW